MNPPSSDTVAFFSQSFFEDSGCALFPCIDDVKDAYGPLSSSISDLPFFFLAARAFFVFRHF